TIILIIIGVLLIVGGIFLVRNKKKTEVTNDNQKNQQTTLETPLAERPYVILVPRADGKEFTLDITRIKNAKTIEYELVYESQGLSRGVIGSVELSSGETEVSRKLLLGSCSKDVCKYDEGIKQGTLTLRFRGSDGTRKFTSDFHLQEGGKELTSIDEKFKLAGKFFVGTFYLTMPTIGLPEKVEGKIVGGPYGIFTAGSSSAKNSTLTMTFSETPTSAKLFLFDGKSSTEQTGAKIEGSNLTATVNSLGTFFATE
ncbi:hypothetical protein MUP35_03250, partial [Patescibacteria group bacterium]|nr:hypothetical protein [Patescibacteria group bacterium]